MALLNSHSKGNKRYLALALLIPSVLFLLLYIAWGVRPFGERMLLYSDEFYQYCPFFIEFRKALLSGESLFWNWSVGLGMDYMGIISYYLASPLNLPAIFVPEDWVLGYFSLLVPVKLGLASLFFAVSLQKMYGKNDLSIALFGSFYGMCAWAMGYHWNVMWLDTFALLPLVVLGTVQLLRDRKCLLYIVTLFLSVWANYYIGFFVCLFVFLMFICYEYSNYTHRRILLCDFSRIAVCSILSLGLTATLLLPGLKALSNTASSVNSFPTSFYLNNANEELVAAAKEAWAAYDAAKATGYSVGASLLRAMSETFIAVMNAMRNTAKNLVSSSDITFKRGAPNIYCGVVMIPFGFLFLLSNRIARKEKICCLGLLTFLGLSFVLPQLDYIWHGFHFPKDIPYRFSFLYSFIILHMAYRAWTLRDEFNLRQMVAAVVLSFVLLVWSSGSSIPAVSIVIVALAGVTLICAAWINRQKTNPQTETDEPAKSSEYPRRFYRGVLCGIMILELLVNMVNVISSYPQALRSNYPWNSEEMNNVLQEIEDRETGGEFYRVENTHSFTINDGALYGYDGVSTFTSSANATVTAFMKKLGFQARQDMNRYVYEQTSPIATMFLNVKYMTERNGQHREDTYWSEVYSSGSTILLENAAYLPLGFLADSELGEFAWSETESGVEFQNAIFQAATGVEDDVITYEPDSNSSIYIDEALDLTPMTEHGRFAYEPDDITDGKIIYTFQATQEGLMCLDITMPYTGIRFYVYKQTVTETGAKDTLLYDEQYIYPQMLSVCDVQPGDIIKIEAVIDSTFTDKKSGEFWIRSVIVQENVFWEGFDTLSTSTLELSEFATDHILGSITCQRDGLVYTSVPQDGNWRVYLDGEEINPTLVCDVMISIPVTEGTHTIEMHYRNNAWTAGTIVSGISLCLLACLAFVERRRRQK